MIEGLFKRATGLWEGVTVGETCVVSAVLGFTRATHVLLLRLRGRTARMIPLGVYTKTLTQARPGTMEVRLRELHLHDATSQTLQIRQFNKMVLAYGRAILYGTKASLLVQQHLCFSCYSRAHNVAVRDGIVALRSLLLHRDSQQPRNALSPYAANASSANGNSRPQMSGHPTGRQLQSQPIPRHRTVLAVGDEVEDEEDLSEGEEGVKAGEERDLAKTKGKKGSTTTSKAKEDGNRGLTRLNADGELEWLARADSKGSKASANRFHLS